MSSSISDQPKQKPTPWDLSRFTRLVAEQGVVILWGMIVGVLAVYGSFLFTLLIEGVNQFTVQVFLTLTQTSIWGYIRLAATPAVGIVPVSWFTWRLAPEAQGHGVPEVIKAVAKADAMRRYRQELLDRL